jgi:hypothetical protein
MAWPARSRFSLLNSRFQDFLFASIGNDEKGMPLSVASAMARLDVDPWTEAGRLVHLPRVKAAEALASMISRIPLANCEATLALDIADRLVALLPASSASSWIPPSRLSRPPSRWQGRLVWLACLALIAAAVFSVVSDRMTSVDAYGVPAIVRTTTP